MKTICAWCRKVIKEGNGKVTHGICDPCRDKMRKQLEERRKRRRK